MTDEVKTKLREKLTAIHKKNWQLLRDELTPLNEDIANMSEREIIMQLARRKLYKISTSTQQKLMGIAGVTSVFSASVVDATFSIMKRLPIGTMLLLSGNGNGHNYDVGSTVLKVIAGDSSSTCRAMNPSGTLGNNIEVYDTLLVDSETFESLVEEFMDSMSGEVLQRLYPESVGDLNDWF